MAVFSATPSIMSRHSEFANSFSKETYRLKEKIETNVTSQARCFARQCNRKKCCEQKEKTRKSTNGIKRIELEIKRLFHRGHPSRPSIILALAHRPIDLPCTHPQHNLPTKSNLRRSSPSPSSYESVGASHAVSLQTSPIPSALPASPHPAHRPRPLTQCPHNTSPCQCKDATSLC